MADADDPRPRADEDLLDVLSRRVRQLSVELADAQGELETARKRVAVYETFDESVQGAMTAALRAAYDISVRAEQQAATLLVDARAERDQLLAEIARLERQRQALEEQPPPMAGSPRSFGAEDPQLADLRTRAQDALASLLDEFVAEKVVGLPTAPPRSPMERIDERSISQTPPPTRLVGPEMTPLAAVPSRWAASVPPDWSDEDRLDQIELVVFDVPAFARLVEVELRIRELPNVRTIYVKEYRDDIVRLTVGLAVPSTTREFGELVANIAHPRIVVVRSSHAILELRLEGEAAVA